MIQVSHSLANSQTREREFRAIEDASKELPIESALILSDTSETEVMIAGIPVKVQAIPEWLICY